MLKRFDRYVFNSLKVAITGMCWYALFAIPYEKIFEASIEAKIIFGLLVWSIWSFMTIIVELKDDGGKVNTNKRYNDMNKNFKDKEPIVGYYDGCKYNVWEDEGWYGELALKRAFAAHTKEEDEGFMTVPHLILYKDDFAGWVNEQGYVVNEEEI